MSLSRLSSGALAAFTRVAVVLAIQIALVPLYLSSWTTTQYGYWMIFQAALVIVTIPDLGLQAFVEVDYVRRGRASGRRLSYLLSRNISTGLLLSLFQILFVALLVATHAVEYLLAPAAGDMKYANDVGWALLNSVLAWPLASSVSGSMGRASTSFGSIAKSTWWSVVTLFVTNLVSAVAAYNGLSIRQASAASAVAGSIAGMACIAYFMFDFSKYKMSIQLSMARVSLPLATQALGLMLKTLFETIKGHSIRLIASRVIGVAPMVSVSIHRTLTGAFQQGFSVISAPMLPEYIRAQIQKDRRGGVVRLMRTQWAFCTVLIIPAAAFLPLIGPSLFSLWTHGKINFDPILYFWLVCTIILNVGFAPFYQYVQSMNLVSAQAVISACGLVSVVTLLPLLGHAWGVYGVGAALASVEVIQGSVCMYFLLRVIADQSVVRGVLREFVFQTAFWLLCILLPVVWSGNYMKIIAFGLALLGSLSTLLMMFRLRSMSASVLSQ